jgi:UDP-3-O-[3-hydroxymyristoyl] glucosamine N-acyltransferase
MEWKVGDIALRIGAALEGDPERAVTGVAAIQDAGPGDLTFCVKGRPVALVAGSSAAAVIVPLDHSGTSSAALLKSSDPYRAFLSVMPLFVTQNGDTPRAVHPSAVVHPGARLGKNVAVGPLSIVEDRVELEDNVTLAAGVFVGAGSRVGEGSCLFPHVVVLERVTLGKRVIVHSGTVLGSDGFGYLSCEGAHEKVPQVGTVVVEDDVEFGANVTVDRGTLGETRIGRGTKIDNLVHIAHNVVIGENTLLVAQVGISGSTRIGKNVILAGQSGVAGHITVGDGAMVGAQSGVTKPVPPGARVSGYPAMNHDRARRLHVYYRRLPALFEELRRLEGRIRELERERERVL